MVCDTRGGLRGDRLEGNANLVGAAIAMAVLGFAAVQAYQDRTLDQEQANDYSLGDFLTTANDAATTYITANFATLAPPLKAAVVPTSIPWATVAAAVPGSVTSPTPYGQTLSLVIRAQKNIDQDGNGTMCQADAGELCPVEGFVVVSGGVALNDARLARVARRVSQGHGGGIFNFIRMNAVTAPAVSSAAGSDTWTVLDTDFAPIAWPGTGHPMARTVIGGGETDTLSLSRFPHPTANQMHATITMNRFNITGAGDVCLDSTIKDGACLSDSVQEMSMLASGSVVTKPVCPAGKSADILLSVAKAAAGNGHAMIGQTVGSTDNGATWTIHMWIDTENDAGTGIVTIEPDAAHGALMVSTKCS